MFLGKFLFNFEIPFNFFLNFRWTEGPKIIDNVVPVVVSFDCVDDQVIVWNLLQHGCRTANIKVTKDSRTLKETEKLIINRKEHKINKKIDYHVNCMPENHSDGGCLGDHDDRSFDDDFSKGDTALIVHGISSDWVEEEMMEDDIDFITDVLETKVYKLLKNIGIKKKVKFLFHFLIFHLKILKNQVGFANIFRWDEGPLYRGAHPIVIILKQR